MLTCQITLDGPHGSWAPSQFTGPTWQQSSGRCCPLSPSQHPKWDHRKPDRLAPASEATLPGLSSQLALPRTSDTATAFLLKRRTWPAPLATLLCSVSSSFLLLENAASPGPGLQPRFLFTAHTSCPVSSCSVSHLHPPPFRGFYNFATSVPTFPRALDPSSLAPFTCSHSLHSS